MHIVWLRTIHVFVPAADTSSGSRSPNSKYCGANAAPAGRSIVRVALELRAKVIGVVGHHRPPCLGSAGDPMGSTPGRSPRNTWLR